MKFRVEHDELAEAVAWVARALPTRPVVPVLSGLRLEAADGLTLSCFDYELSAAVRVPAQVSEPGTALVPGRLLAEITRSLPPQPVEFGSEAEWMTLTCGSAEFALVSLPLAEYPTLPAAPPLTGTVDGGELAAAVAQVLPAASRDDTLPMLTAVCLDIHDEVVTLAATDRYRLAVRELRWQPSQPGLRAIALVPARTLADAARTMAAGTPVSVAFGADDAADGPGRGPRPAEGMIAFESGERRLMGRLIGGEFIRYQSRFPAEFGCWAEIPAGSFTEAVRRVSLVADRASPVRLSFGPDHVAIGAQTEGQARAVETVTAAFQGDEPDIAFSPQYLLDGLTAAAAGRAGPPDGVVAGAVPAGTGGAGSGGAEPPPRIRLQFTSPAKPALITLAAPVNGGSDGAVAAAHDGGTATAAGTGQPPFRYLVVPLRPPSRV